MLVVVLSNIFRVRGEIGEICIYSCSFIVRIVAICDTIYLNQNYINDTSCIITQMMGYYVDDGQGSKIEGLLYLIILVIIHYIS